MRTMSKVARYCGGGDLLRTQVTKIDPTPHMRTLKVSPDLFYWAAPSSGQGQQMREKNLEIAMPPVISPFEEAEQS